MPPVDRPSSLDWYFKALECPFARVKSTGEVLRIHNVYFNAPSICVSSLDDDRTWTEHPRDLEWLSEIEVLAHVSA